MSSPNEIKATVRVNFKEYVKDNYNKDFGALTSVEQGIALTKYYILKIYNPVSDPIDEDDLENNCTDGPCDSGADLIYRDNNKVLIIQSKYLKEGAIITEDKISHFQNILCHLKDPSRKFNSRIKEIIREIDFENDEFDLRFICLGKIGENGKNQTKAEPNIPNIKDLLQRVTISFYDENELNNELRNSLSISGKLPGEQKLYSAGDRGNRIPIMPIHLFNHKSYLFVIDANQLAELYKSAKDSLFTLNIRNYLGNTAINKKMVATANNFPENFIFFNNGISCLVTSADLDEERQCLTVKGLQIINGAQTVKALYNVYKNAAGGSSWKNGVVPKVICRVTVVGEELYKTLNSQFRDGIIVANNSQNIIKNSDFRSNDPIQNDLKNKFSENSRYGRKVVYISKRTDQKPQRCEIIPMQDFAKTIYSFLFNPSDFDSNTNFLFDNSSSGGYVKIFGDGNSTSDFFTAEQFRLRSVIWWLAKEFEKERKSHRQQLTDNAAWKALERKWILFYTARLVLVRNLGDDYKSRLSRYYKGEWEMGKGKDGECFFELYKIVTQTVIYKYKEAAQREKFEYRSWICSKDTENDLSIYIGSAPGIENSILQKL